MPSTRPDKHNRRSSWNSSWETTLTSKWRSPGPEKFFVGRPSSWLAEIREIVKSGLVDHDVYIQTQEIIGIQRDLAGVVSAEGALDTKWRGLTQTRREELVLEGLYTASCAGPDMEDRREWCPEMSLSKLSRPSGEGSYIALVNVHVVQHTTNPADAVHLTNSRFDTVFQLPSNDNSGLEKLVEVYRLKRAYFITMTLWTILNAYRGVTEAVRTVQYETRRALETDGAEEALRSLGRLALDTELTPDQLRQLQSVRTDRPDVYVCYTCKTEASTTIKLSNCVPCTKIGRTVRYCSKECQKQDWKSGSPVPHKRMCGKRSFDPTPTPVSSTRSTSSSTSSSEPFAPAMLRYGQAAVNGIEPHIPRADRGYVRTFDVFRQIMLLHTLNFTQDYVLIPDDAGPGKETHGVRFTDPLAKRPFMIARRRAMKCGDAQAIRYMYDTLLPFAARENVPAHKVAAQLEREYNMSVDFNIPRNNNVILSRTGEKVDLRPETDEEEKMVVQALCAILEEEMGEEAFLAMPNDELLRILNAQ